MTTIDATALTAFVAPAPGTPVVMGRAARRAVIESFNNVTKMEVAHLSTGGDAYVFGATIATAAGIARESGLTVYAYGDRYVALSPR